MGGLAIGIAGYARSGKTTVARYLEDRYGFRRLHIADPIRAMLRELMWARGISEERIDRYLTGDLKDGVVIPEFGVTSRHLQVTLGTEWGRMCVHENLWANTWMSAAHRTQRPMNDSVRFENEAIAVRSLGGIVLRVDRSGIGPGRFKSDLHEKVYRITGWKRMVHHSERIDLIQPDGIIDNSGDLPYLYTMVDTAMRYFRVDPLPVKSVFFNETEVS